MTRSKKEKEIKEDLEVLDVFSRQLELTHPGARRP